MRAIIQMLARFIAGWISLPMLAVLAACGAPVAPSHKAPPQNAQFHASSGEFTIQPGTTGLAWVWNDQVSAPLNVPYTPDPNDQFNNDGLTRYLHSPIQITRMGTGRYRVGLGFYVAGGVAHVVAYGGNHHCNLLRYGATPFATELYVNCYSPGGEPSDGLFTAYYQSLPSPSAASYVSEAYLASSQLSGAAGSCVTPDNWYNSRLGVNQVCFLGTGQYEVRLPLMDGPGTDSFLGGHLQVTALSQEATQCKVMGWSEAEGGVRASVQCHLGKVLSNSQFTLSFMRWAGLKHFDYSGLDGDYLFADGPDVPSLLYQRSRAVRMRRTGVGAYRVALPVELNDPATTVQVTPYGAYNIFNRVVDPNTYCSVMGWGQPSTTVNVQCYNVFGHPADAQFTLLFLTNHFVPE